MVSGDSRKLRISVQEQKGDIKVFRIMLFLYRIKNDFDHEGCTRFCRRSSVFESKDIWALTIYTLSIYNLRIESRFLSAVMIHLMRFKSHPKHIKAQNNACNIPNIFTKFGFPIRFTVKNKVKYDTKTKKQDLGIVPI